MYIFSTVGAFHLDTILMSVFYFSLYNDHCHLPALILMKKFEYLQPDIIKQLKCPIK